MAHEGKADEQLFQLLAGLLHQVESLTNQEEVELRTKIEALGLEVTKVPSKSLKQLDEVSMITFHIHSLHIYLFNCASISMKKWILPNI
ncbi:hypothetical protein IC582_002356 [Cucumis melo]